MCDVWSPRATNGVGESQGHYVDAVRALETLPCISVCLSLCFSPCPSSHPFIQTRPGSQRHFNGSNENSRESAGQTYMRGKRERVKEGWGGSRTENMHAGSARMGNSFWLTLLILSNCKTEIFTSLIQSEDTCKPTVIHHHIASLVSLLRKWLFWHYCRDC